MTIKQALNFGYRRLQKKDISSAYLDAEILLSFAIKKPREFVLAHNERRLSATEQKKYSALIARRAKYEPVAYLLGYKEFYGLKIKINKKALIPRPETELLVEMVADAYSRLVGSKPAIIDIGTGSGVIALALKKTLPKARILAVEASATTLALARQNAKNLHLSPVFLKRDLLAKVPVKWLDRAILAVNLPYVDRAEIAGFSREIRLGLKYEPDEAIFADQQGTALYEKLFRQISNLPTTAQPSLIVAEIGSHHFKKFVKLANKYFVQAKIELKKDLAGRNRFLIIRF